MEQVLDLVDTDLVTCLLEKDTARDRDVRKTETPSADSCGEVERTARDLMVTDVERQDLEAMSELPVSWFAWASQCLGYGALKPQRVRYWTDEEGGVRRAIFYRQRGVALTVSADPALTRAELEGLIRDRGALWATVGLLDSPFLPGEDFQAGWRPRPSATEMKVIHLADDPEKYLQSLGRNTRKHLPYYLRRLEREWSDLEKIAIEGTDIGSEVFGEVVSLNAKRLGRRGARQVGWSSEALSGRWQLAQRCGLICGVKHDGRLIGGTITYVRGSEAFLVGIGHDPEYDRLNVGNVCLWLTIHRLIAMNVTKLNLLWGSAFYKAQFGAVSEVGYSVTVCRGRVAVAIHWLYRKGSRGGWYLGRCRNALWRALGQRRPFKARGTEDRRLG